MSTSDRDRIRALVRNVLNQALPESDRVDSGAGERPAPEPIPSNKTSSHFIDVAPKASAAGATVTRDESSKLVITEDDVRGLEQGAVLRIAEGARLTPLAADVIREKGIEITRRTSRRGTKGSKMIAVGADHGGFKMKESSRAF